MRNKSVFLLSVLAVSLVSACTLLSKKELVNSLVVRVSAEDLFSELAMHSQDADFRLALEQTHEMQLEQQDRSYTELFGEAWEKIAPETHMILHFFPRGFHETLAPDADNAEVLAALQKELDYRIDATMNALRVRLDRFGLTHHYIQRIDLSEEILIELPEVENADRLKRLIVAKGELRFWPSYDLSKVLKYLEKANAALGDPEEEFPLYSILDFSPVMDQSGRLMNLYGALTGTVLKKDTARMNDLLEQEQNVFPEDLHFYWGHKPLAQDGESVPLYAIQAENTNKAPLNYTHITDARPQMDSNDQFEVGLSMNSIGARLWQRLSADHIGECIVVMLDDYVYACLPVEAEVTGGETVIRGSFTEQEALDLANILQTGPLPLAVRVVKVDFQ